MDPSALELGHSGMLFKVCRAKFGLTDLPAGPLFQPVPTQQIMPGLFSVGQGMPLLQTHPALVYSGVAVPTQASQLAGVTPDGGLFLSKLHLDENSQAYAVLCTKHRIAELLDAWQVRENDGEEPAIGTGATPHQI